MKNFALNIRKHGPLWICLNTPLKCTNFVRASQFDSHRRKSFLRPCQMSCFSW